MTSADRVRNLRERARNALEAGEDLGNLPDSGLLELLGVAFRVKHQRLPELTRELLSRAGMLKPAAPRKPRYIYTQETKREAVRMWRAGHPAWEISAAVQQLTGNDPSHNLTRHLRIWSEQLHDGQSD